MFRRGGEEVSAFINRISDRVHGEEYWLTRALFFRGLGAVYFFVFFPLLNQYQPLLGEAGLLPVRSFLQRVEPFLESPFWDLPTLFWLSTSDTFAFALIGLGLALSILLLIGYGHCSILLLLWLLQLSFTHVGQDFWSFGWESNLLETGFLAILMSPVRTLTVSNCRQAPHWLIIFLCRWTMFRLMVGSALIKLRGDPCWSDFSCLRYHFETQPIPNPLSFLFHALPTPILSTLVFVTHFIELVIPFGAFFLGSRLRHMTGVCFLFLQIGILVTGNYAWINYLTIVMIVPFFNDGFLRAWLPFWKNHQHSPVKSSGPTLRFRVFFYSLVALVYLVLSIRPALNLINRDVVIRNSEVELRDIQQVMNRSYDQFHLVNSYGLFGGITRRRYEVIISGTDGDQSDPNTKWVEYEFPCKPGDVSKMPCFRSPYHYRITWQLWFAAMASLEHNRWLFYLASELVLGNDKMSSLLERNPFEEKPPKFVKMDLYRYFLKGPFEEGSTWYERSYVRPYMSPISVDHPAVKNYLSKRYRSE